MLNICVARHITIDKKKENGSKLATEKNLEKIQAVHRRFKSNKNGIVCTRDKKLNYLMLMHAL